MVVAGYCTDEDRRYGTNPGKDQTERKMTETPAPFLPSSPQVIWWPPLTSVSQTVYKECSHLLHSLVYSEVLTITQFANWEKGSASITQ